MLGQVDFVSVGRNIAVYLVGVGLAIVGALGMADAIDLGLAVSVLLLTLGLAAVLVVHEYFDGPV